MMFKMSLIAFVVIAFFELTKSENTTKICEDVDDKIMLNAVYDYYTTQMDYCSPKDDPYNDDYMLSISRGYLTYHCTDLFEEWFRDVASEHIFDMNSCKLRDYDHFFDVYLFVDYLKNKSIPKDKYTRMIISAQCNLEKANDDYFHARDIYKSKMSFIIRDQFTKNDEWRQVKGFGSDRGTQKNPSHQQWISNRFAYKLVECFIKDEHLYNIMSPVEKPSPKAPIDTPTFHNGTKILLILGSILISITLAVIFAYKSKIRNIVSSKVYRENGLYFKIQDNIISEE
ncbi:hypothetical protein RF11_05868 [Thelohanellus kitauei]|uniref:Uncharacterized protein n=1 Tax=Thelohanellus kitauei TaxID=669202 RepID=A0A0C2M278_THEKT|nr:hypothetical protein RF11_05868 [Thelohanellus kitauei]